MSSQPDVLILGGGVIGLTTAYHLARAGVAVTVVDKGDLGQESSWAGAGILPPGNPARTTTAYARLLAESSQGFATFTSELTERTGVNTGYRVCGGLEIAPEGEATSEEEWRRQGLRVEVLDAVALGALEPALRAPTFPVHRLPDMAQVRNPRHLKALIAACTSLGVRLIPGCPVGALIHQGPRVTAALGGTGALHARQFLITTGAWTDALLLPFGVRLGVHPVRGQIALLQATPTVLRHIVEVGKRYLVPRGDGRILIGSTEEYAEFDKRTTAASIRELLDFALGLIPELANAPLERTWAGLRPGTPDGLPYLGPVPGMDNLYVAAGHFRAGIQLSLITGQILTDLLKGLPPRLPIEAFRLDRPPFLPSQGRD